MKNITQYIRQRRSVRTFDPQPLTQEDRKQLSTFMQTIENPFQIPVELKWLDVKEHGLSCPVVVGEQVYVGGKVKCCPYASVAFGYAFEQLVLKAQSMGIGTVWIGGTMKRSTFEKAMDLAEDETMPCVTPLGYPARKMSVRESIMRKGSNASQRLPFETLFFDKDFSTPLTPENAGVFREPLEMVRLGPSAVNRQPWRAVVEDQAVHFYLKRSKVLRHDARIDMQKVDMGIALCHFALSAEHLGLYLTFRQEAPKEIAGTDLEYIASYYL